MTYQPKSYRKFVATAATATLVASAIAPAASAATFTDVSDRYKEAVDYLVENGVAQGTAEAKFGTADSIKRVDAAVMVARLLDLEDADAPDAGFTDVPDRGQWAVNALKEKGIINGKTATSFGSQDSMTRAEMAKVIANAYELTGSEDLPFTDVSATFETYVKAIFEAGITQGKTDTQFGSNQDVTRGEFALFVHRAEMMEDEVVAPEVTSVSAITSKSLKVDFNGAVDTDGVSFSVKRGSTVVVLDAMFSEDKKSATLTSATPLVAGDYTIVVNGGEFKEGTNTATVKVEAQKETSLTILNESVQKVASAKVSFEVKNQYGEVMDVVSSNVVATGYDKTAKDATNTEGPVTFSPVAGKTQFEANLTPASIAAGDEILLTLTYKGLTATKTLTVAAASALSTLELAAPSPLKDKTRITVGETIELPYTAMDQYGKAINLPTTTADNDGNANQEKIGDYLFTSSDPSVIDVDAITIDADGKMKFVAAAAGTTKITAVNVKNGAMTSVNVEVSAAATEDTIVLTAPSKLVAANETVKVPFTAYDQFGGMIKTADLNTGNVALASSKPGVATVAWNGKEIEITGVSAGTTEITATIGSKVAKFSIDIQAAAVPAKITGVKDLATVLTDGAVSTLDTSKVTIKDQYGRDYKLTGTQGIAVYAKDGVETSLDVQQTAGDVTAADLANAGLVSADNTSKVSLTGTSTAGTETLVLQLVSNTATPATTAVPGGSFEVSVATKAQAEVTSYELKEVPTLFAKGGADFTSSYAKALEVVAKDSSGNVVALPTSAVQSVTSSNVSVATVDKASMKVLGQAKGTATVSVVVNTADGLKTVQKTVTVSDEARIAQSIKSNGTDGVFTYSTAALPTNDDLAVDAAGSGDIFFTVTDQYEGKELTPADYIISGEVDTDNSMAVTVTAGALTITGADASDSVKLTAVDGSGHTSTLTIKFN